jgi:hypothetical protein
MSVTPRRPSSSAASTAQTTRRVSFSPVVDEILNSLEKRRSRVSYTSRPVDVENDTTSERNPSEPSTTSHRTRLAAGYSPARRRISEPSPSLPDGNAGRATTTTTTTTMTSNNTTTIEFSLKDIPLDGKMAPPIWREPSPGRSNSSRRASSAGGGTPMSARLSKSLLNGVESNRDSDSVDGASAVHPINPYADPARDSANMLRRQRVVRTFFESHEDAVRLYIRLQQLLSYRDMCHNEFQQQLQLMNSDEERQAAVAARAQRVAAQEREIQRVQTALAKANVTRPEFASSMNSLYSTPSATPSRQPAPRGGEAPTRVSPAKGRVGMAATAAAPTDSPRVVAPQAKTKAEPVRKATHTEKQQQQRSPSSPRRASPRKALEAWRRSQSQEKPKSTESLSLESGAAYISPRHHDCKPRDRVTLSGISAPHPNAGRVGAGSMATVLPAQQQTPPPPRATTTLRQTVPLGNNDGAVVPAAADLRSADHFAPLPPFSAVSEAGSTATTGAVAKASLYKVAPAATRSTDVSSAQVPLPLPPASQEGEAKPKTAVNGLVTPPRSTPSSTPRSTDSPLARFRKRQGYEDPVEHFRSLLPRAHTPLRSQSSLRSARSSPRCSGGVEALADSTKPSNNNTGEQVNKKDDRVAAKATPGKEGSPAAGRSTALLLASEKAPSERRGTPSPAKQTRPVTAAAAGTLADRLAERKSSPVVEAAAPKRLVVTRINSGKETSQPADQHPPSPLESTSRPLKNAVSALVADIQAWSPADPPELVADSNEGIRPGLVPCAKASPSPPGQHTDSTPVRECTPETQSHSALRSPQRTAVLAAAARPPPLPSASVWDDIADLERRVFGLEGRTADLERNAAKRAVLDAIHLLRERVTLLEERATILERDEGKESAASQLRWRRE